MIRRYVIPPLSRFPYDHLDHPSGSTLRCVARRTWFFVVVGAILGAALGLVYVLVFDPLCGCEVLPAQCSCPLAVPVWASIGVVGGGLVGLVAARVTRRT